MAESQASYQYTNSGGEIKTNLSEERFAPYMQRAGHRPEYAFNLYLYNARLSKAFLFPLHILEVSLRNRINAIFSADFGTHWPHDVTFRATLSDESQSALDKGMKRAKSTKTEDVVATLTFDFWSNLFRPEYDRPFWQKNMKILTPCAPDTTRRDLQRAVKALNDFRNRIAHHEPIHSLDVSIQHSKILDTISLFSLETSSWVKHHSTVNQMIRTKPSSNGEAKPHFFERCDDDFASILDNTTLSKLPATRFFLCHDNSGSFTAILEMQHIAKYFFSLAEKSDLLVDLNEHDLCKVIQHQKLCRNFETCGGSESFSKSRVLLKKTISYIIVLSDDQVLGVIAKAHRCY